MALHLTKVAFGASSLEQLVASLDARQAVGGVFMTTRYLPKRHTEIVGAGSLYWILKHQLVARSPIERFGEAEGGRVAIHLGAVVLVASRPKRAHQGWRYLEADDAPADLPSGSDGVALPVDLAGKLAALGLI